MACRRSESLTVGDVGEVVGLWHLSWAIDQAVFFKKGERERDKEKERRKQRERRTDRAPTAAMMTLTDLINYHSSNINQPSW